MTRTPAWWVEVTVVATGHRFVSVAPLADAGRVYRDGYVLRDVWGIPTRHGFHHLACENEPREVAR